jgi:hypothetical protein
LAVLADHALVDQQGKLSVIGIWRNVVVPQLPGVHPRAHLVLLLAGDHIDLGDHRVGLALVDPSGVVRLEHHGGIQMRDPDPAVDEVEAPGVVVLDLPLAEVGPHAIVITLDGAQAARLPFTVSLPPRQGATVH